MIDAYFSGTKLKWLLDSIPGARDRAARGELAFGTIDSWLVYQLSDGKTHVTDASNASRTLLFDIRRGEWDDELLRVVRRPARDAAEARRRLVGRVRGNASRRCARADRRHRGRSAGGALRPGVPCTPGMAKNTYGTGCFLLLNTGENAVASQNNLVTTVAWKRGDKDRYALEGSVFIAGAVVQWLRDGLQVIRTAADVEALAASVPDNGGVYLRPRVHGPRRAALGSARARHRSSA